MAFQDKFEEAWRKTKILRPVEKKLFTFGDTRLPYFLVAASLVNPGDTVVRKGIVVVDRPIIYAPSPGHPLFEGFGEKGEQVAGLVIQRLMRLPPYKYKNEAARLYVASDPLDRVVARLNQKLDRDNDHLCVIIQTLADMWEVSLMRYVAERMIKSIPSNLRELRERGFLGEDWLE